MPTSEANSSPSSPSSHSSAANEMGLANIEQLQEFIRQDWKVATEQLLLLNENLDLQKKIAESVLAISQRYAKGGNLYFIGNGGSAADAQHIVAELVVRLQKNRSALRAFSLTVDTSILTACANDFSYDFVFVRQLEAHLKPQDILISLTTSGQSPNIIKAMELAQTRGALNILFSGKQGGAARELADFALLAPGLNTAHIQQAHSVMYHSFCLVLEQLFIQLGLAQYEII